MVLRTECQDFKSLKSEFQKYLFTTSAFTISTQTCSMIDSKSIVEDHNRKKPLKFRKLIFFANNSPKKTFRRPKISNMIHRKPAVLFNQKSDKSDQ